MPDAPLKRIYFDTNILYHWPHLPNDLLSVLGVANWVRSELYLPSVVEDELEGQFVREAERIYDALAANAKDLERLARDVFVPDINGSRHESAQLRTDFRTRSGQLKTHFGIVGVPLTAKPLNEFVEMAINRVPPFEEVDVGKKRQVVGLQDAAILFSIVEHMRTAQEADRCALVSADGVFHKAETRRVLERAGVRLQLFKNVRSLFDDLFSHVWEAVRTAWRAEMQQVETSLNEQKEQLSKQILPLLKPSDVGGGIGGVVKEIVGISIREFSLAQTELPESEHRPPNAQAYTRPEGSSVSLSARASMEIDAVVEKFNWFSLGLLVGQRPPLEEPPPPPAMEENRLHETVTVSFTGNVQNGVIGNFRVIGVERSR